MSLKRAATRIRYHRGFYVSPFELLFLICIARGLGIMAFLLRSVWYALGSNEHVWRSLGNLAIASKYLHRIVD
jgi:hypothetical protein